MRYCIYFLCFFALFSCTDNLSESKICNVKNPLIDLVWLKEIKTGLEISTSASKKKITQFTYNNESVFLVDICINCTDNLTSLYSCDGTIVCEFGGIAGLNTCPDFDKNATNEIILWEN